MKKTSKNTKPFTRKTNTIESYEITEILGEATPMIDPNATVVKGVIRTLLSAKGREPEEGIDIRRFNKSNMNTYNGIRLTLEEAHQVADILISHGFGSTEVIEAELNRRKDLWKHKEVNESE